MILAAYMALLAVVFPPPPRPKLVVVITVDQLRPDYFARWKGQLTGGLAQLMNEGAVFTEGYQDHAVTETAPGHATVLSGLWPAHTGIIRNAEGVQDSLAPLLDAPPGSGASPRRFRGTVLLDWMRATDPQARGLSVSVKDRGAILPFGKARADVFWLSFRTGRFTTSRYYMDSLPQWVTAFNAAGRPPGPWTLLLPDSAYKEVDDEPWENGGVNRTFPHPVSPNCAAAPSPACAVTPALDSVTLELALAGVQALRLGRRNGADLLAVSLSVTDFIGHSYGPDSREVHDQVLRLDRALGWFFKRLGDRVGRDNFVVVLTADHGVTPFPVRTRTKTGAAAYDVQIDTLITAVNRDLDRLAGGGASREWLEFESGMLFLRDNGRFAATGVKTDSVLDALAARILRVQGVARVTKPADLARADTASDPVARRWLHQLTPDAGVVLTVTLQPKSAWGIANTPIAMHGQPSDDDAHVPIIFWGRGVKRGTYAGRANTVDIAPTLGALLGVTPLSLLDGHARTEALEPR